MNPSNTTPLSGWLQKLTTTNAFGASRWQSRYFVLLDSEMRYYKDEHSVTASRTVNLGDIAKVIMTSSPNHPYSFRLEPTLYAQHTKNQKKIWTMECKSATELELWVSAINYRLCKLLKLDDDEEQEEQAGIVSPTLQPFSTPEQRRAQPLMSLFRVLTTSSSESSESIDQHIKPQPRPLRKHNSSISRRRGVILSPIDIETIPGLENDMLSSSSSRGSSLPSPKTQTIVERYDEEEEEEECQGETKGQANKVVAQNAYVLDTSSPTFALYKERYHL
ncbi:hypothetical protein HMPREF1544_05089 [Mucor circinelloides 1006PhL]|uniref:PH domain-containing protein n=1 Tax=Mucor circinelloides f. circinelloides (strain 1006PhL) TaxID=1220926 RepID=S2K7C0_MUCC1|nr:hypothetical protein HMPREF1544_05089 [Mucor circinelloides 1006PhL]KAG1106233.1 hypothetical protein G6F42_016833 [Rhizopus arrhizus]